MSKSLIYTNKKLYFEQLEEKEKRSKEAYRFTIDQENRSNIWLKSMGHCWYCGEYFDYDSRYYTIDHVVAISKGGVDSVENLVIACKPCNCKKHNKSIDEFRLMYQQRNGMIISESQKKWLLSKGIEIPKPDPYFFYFEKVGLS